MDYAILNTIHDLDAGTAACLLYTIADYLDGFLEHQNRQFGGLDGSLKEVPRNLIGLAHRFQTKDASNFRKINYISRHSAHPDQFLLLQAWKSYCQPRSVAEQQIHKRMIQTRSDYYQPQYDPYALLPYVCSLFLQSLIPDLGSEIAPAVERINTILENYFVFVNQEVNKDLIPHFDLFCLLNAFKSHANQLISAYDSQQIDQLVSEKRQNGNIALRNNNPFKAIAEYSEAIAISKNEYLLANRAAAYTNLQKMEDAIIDAREATDLNPAFTAAWIRWGYAALYEGLVEDALKAYVNAINAAYGRLYPPQIESGSEDQKQIYTTTTAAKVVPELVKKLVSSLGLTKVRALQLGYSEQWYDEAVVSVKDIIIQYNPTGTTPQPQGQPINRPIVPTNPTGVTSFVYNGPNQPANGIPQPPLNIPGFANGLAGVFNGENGANFSTTVIDMNSENIGDNISSTIRDVLQGFGFQNQQHQPQQQTQQPEPSQPSPQLNTPSVSSQSAQAPQPQSQMNLPSMFSLSTQQSQPQGSSQPQGPSQPTLPLNIPSMFSLRPSQPPIDAASAQSTTVPATNVGNRTTTQATSRDEGDQLRSTTDANFAGADDEDNFEPDLDIDDFVPARPTPVNNVPQTDSNQQNIEAVLNIATGFLPEGLRNVVGPIISNINQVNNTNVSQSRSSAPQPNVEDVLNIATGFLPEGLRNAVGPILSNINQVNNANVSQSRSSAPSDENIDSADLD